MWKLMLCALCGKRSTSRAQNQNLQTLLDFWDAICLITSSTQCQSYFWSSWSDRSIENVRIRGLECWMFFLRGIHPLLHSCSHLKVWKLVLVDFQIHCSPLTNSQPPHFCQTLLFVIIHDGFAVGSCKSWIRVFSCFEPIGNHWYAAEVNTRFHIRWIL